MIDFLLEKITEQNENFEEIDFLADNFICKDWNVYYNLYNPENFEDPENPSEWYDVSDVYEYYETPLYTSKKVTIYSTEKIEDFTFFKDLFKNSLDIEKKLLHIIVNYTFGNDGGYGIPEHYEYAKKTMENLHKSKMTNNEFIKRNLCIDMIQLVNNKNELILHFHCGWDEEHGLMIKLKNNEVILMG